MKVVVDANRFFAALLAEGAARQAFMTTRATLAAPAYLLLEVERHRAMLARRSGLARNDFDALVDRLAGHVRWVPDEAVEAHLQEASEALGAIDPKDVAYLACAWAIGADAIWGHDKDFDEQDLVPRVGHPDAARARKP